RGRERQAAAPRFLRRLVCVVQGNGALHVRGSADCSRLAGLPAAAGRRHGEQRSRQGAARAVSTVRSAGHDLLRRSGARSARRPRHRLRARGSFPAKAACHRGSWQPRPGMRPLQKHAIRPLAMPARATRRDWVGLAVIALPCALYAMDLTVLDLALPAISADLRPSNIELLWIVDIYGFLVAGSLITMGTLGDRVGHRRVLLIGGAAFGVASVVAAFATSPGILIVARAVLGIGGATFAPSTLSLIRNMFEDPDERSIAISVWATSYSAGGAAGPSLGGFLLAHFWWGSVFLAGIPLLLA